MIEQLAHELDAVADFVRLAFQRNARTARARTQPEGIAHAAQVAVIYALQETHVFRIVYGQ